MPIPILGEIYYNGAQSVPFLLPIAKALPWLALLVVVKVWFGGAKNANERVMHSKVAIVTGGTTGIGAAVVSDLASRGCQLILLVRNPTDLFTQDYIQDLRDRYDNALIYAEECDLSSLYSVRKFATKFIDNSPARRLDMVICCAGVMAPPGTARVATTDGVEAHWGINYLAHFQLLTILAPALRVQLMDRDVRVLMATCSSYVLGELDLNDVQFLKRGYPSWRPWRSYGASKMALMSFVCEFQRRMNAHERSDKMPNNVRLFSIDPGLTRTPGMRHWLSFGSLWGLAIYLVTYPFWWLVLKSPAQGAQTFLAAAMSPECGVGEGGKFLRECRGQKYRKEALTSEELGKQLWTMTELMIKDVEKESAKKRALEQKKTGKEQPKPKPKPKPEPEPRITEVQDDEELIKMIEKAQKARAQKEALSKLVAESVEQERRDRAIAKLPAGVLDAPSRNTRSKTEELRMMPKVVEVTEPKVEKAVPRAEVKTEEPKVEVTPAPRSDTPSKNTRRRTKKA